MSQLHLVVGGDGGQVDPLVPLHQLFVVKLELPNMLRGEDKPQLLGTLDKLLHHGGFLPEPGFN